MTKIHLFDSTTEEMPDLLYQGRMNPLLNSIQWTPVHDVLGHTKKTVCFYKLLFSPYTDKNYDCNFNKIHYQHNFEL